MQKGTLKDMIISNDPRVDEALRMADEGNFQQLQDVLQAAHDKPRNSSMDLVNDLGLDQLDLNFFDMGSLPKPSPPASHRSSSPPPSENSASGGAQFQFDDDMWDILDTAAGGDSSHNMSSSVGQDSNMAMSWDARGSNGMSQMGQVGRQRLPSQSGSFSTFFGMSPGKFLFCVLFCFLFFLLLTDISFLRLFFLFLLCNIYIRIRNGSYFRNVWKQSKQ